MTRTLSVVLLVLSCAMPFSQDARAAVSVDLLQKKLELTGDDAILMFRIFQEVRESYGAAPAPFKASYACNELQLPTGQNKVVCVSSPSLPMENTVFSEASAALMSTFMKKEVGYKLTKGVVNCTMPIVSQLECTISEISVLKNGWHSWPRS